MYLYPLLWHKDTSATCFCLFNLKRQDYVRQMTKGAGRTRGRRISPKNPSPKKGQIGRTPKGAYSTRGRSRHLLETPFSEPLLRTLLRTLFFCKTHRRPPSQNPSENPFPRTLPEPSQNPNLRTLCCRTPPRDPTKIVLCPYHRCHREICTRNRPVLRRSFWMISLPAPFGLLLIHMRQMYQQ